MLCLVEYCYVAAYCCEQKKRLAASSETDSPGIISSSSHDAPTHNAPLRALYRFNSFHSCHHSSPFISDSVTYFLILCFNTRALLLSLSLWLCNVPLTTERRCSARATSSSDGGGGCLIRFVEPVPGQIGRALTTAWTVTLSSSSTQQQQQHTHTQWNGKSPILALLLLLL